MVGWPLARRAIPRSYYLAIACFMIWFSEGFPRIIRFTLEIKRVSERFVALVVQKYGGTSVGSLERIKAVAERVGRARARGDQLVVVVSAMAGVTDRLLCLGHDLSQLPTPRQTRALAGAGRQVPR